MCFQKPLKTTHVFCNIIFQEHITCDSDKAICSTGHINFNIFFFDVIGILVVAVALFYKQNDSQDGSTGTYFDIGILEVRYDFRCPRL